MSNTIWRVSFEGTGSHNEDVVTVLHVKDHTTLDIDNLDASQVCDNVDTWLTTLYLNMAATSYTLVAIKATEEVEWWNHAIGRQHVKAKGVFGTRAGADGKTPWGMCFWSKLGIAEVFKGNHGGYHTPPVMNSGELVGTQTVNTAANIWPSMGSFNDALLAGHDHNLGTGHLSLVLYSTTRRRRGEANYYFDATSLTRSVTPRLLRTRVSVP